MRGRERERRKRFREVREEIDTERLRRWRAWGNGSREKGGIQGEGLC